MRDPVIITGTPRSGIWLVAGAFEAAGGFGGHMERNAACSASMENLAVRDRFERPLLEGLGVESRGLGQIPSLDRISGLASSLKDQWRSLIDETAVKEGYPVDSVRFIASQVACLLWPIWHAAYPEATWIIVRRNDSDIYESCRASGFVENYRSAGDPCRRVRTMDELTVLVEGYKARFEEMRRAGLKITEFHPQEIFDGHLSGLQRLLESSGLSWRPEVAEYLRPFQWKHGTLQTQGVDDVTHD